MTRLHILLPLLLSVAAPFLVASPVAAEAASHPVELSFNSARFGKVSVYQPAGTPRGVVLFLSGDGGWNLGVVDMARALTAEGVVVAGVSTPAYMKTLEAEPGSCINPNPDLQILANDVAAQMGLDRVPTPVLVGYSSGATLAYAALAQAPAGQYRGGVSLGFGPDLPGARPWCNTGGLIATRMTKPVAGWLFQPGRVSAPWIVLQGLKDQVVAPAQTQAFVARVPGARIIELPLVGHGFAVERNWMPQFVGAFRALFGAPSVVRPQSADRAGRWNPGAFRPPDAAR